LGIALPEPKVRRWSKADDALLGTMRDEALAKKLNRPARAVSLRRQRHGIPVFAPLRQRWTPATDELFSRFPNAEIARRLGRTVSSVQNRRTRLGIPAPNGPDGSAMSQSISVHCEGASLVGETI
jgi:hypothetical protein